MAPDNNFHRGIEASLSNRLNVVNLYIEAREADDFFYWSASSNKAAVKLKVLYPSLESLTIEDDYLIDAQIDALNIQFLPVSIKWTRRMYLDGRHGR